MTIAISHILALRRKVQGGGRHTATAISKQAFNDDPDGHGNQADKAPGGVTKQW
jgi:hypothetical protein